MTDLVSGFVTQSDIDAYDRDGVVCIRGVMGKEWLERLNAATERCVKESIGDPKKKGFATGGDGGTGRFINVVQMWQWDPDFRATALESPLVEVAADIMQARTVNLFADHLLVKEPGTTERTPWHQDQPYWPMTGKQICSIWVAIDPVSKNGGAVEYVAGSHKWGKWFRPESFGGTDQYTKVTWERCPDIDAQRDRYHILVWELAPGDCLIHQALTVHGASGNRLERRRAGLSIRYAGEDARWDPKLPEKFNSGLRVGDPIDCEVFPRVWSKQG